MSLLCFKNFREINVEEDETSYFIQAAYIADTVKCSNCGNSQNAKKCGKKKLYIKDSPVRGKSVTIRLLLDIFHCSDCDTKFSADVPELSENGRLSRRFILYIIKQCVKKNFSLVSRENGISENTVREIFTTFVEDNQHFLSHTTPRVMGIDDVYVRRVARCIITDIERKKIIELLPKKDLPSINGFFYQMKDKGNVEVVTMDMHRPFYSSVKEAFRDAKIVVDTFHVQRMCNKAIMNFLADTRKQLNLSARRLLLRDRFLLLKRYFKLTTDEKNKLADWKSKWSELAEIYDLKEEFFSIWRISKREDAEVKYTDWKNKMSPVSRNAFNEIISTIENWYDEIFNYFDHRYTNAFTESANNLIKRMQSEGRSYHYETLRSKILFGYSLNQMTDENIILTAHERKNVESSRIKRLKTLRESQNKYHIPDNGHDRKS